MNNQLTTTATRTGSLVSALGAVAALTLGGGVMAHAQGDDARTGSGGYTVLDHPSKPCRLSVEAVANWGETSAHLPQACTYD